VRILRREIGRLGFGGNFVIYDAKESERLLKDVLIELNIDEKKYPAKAFAAAIDECKNAGSSPLDLFSGDQMAERLVRVYAAYQERLRKCNALDFDLLYRADFRGFRKCCSSTVKSGNGSWLTSIRTPIPSSTA
jgi:DNA helicase-2/ATP-dependent DNA helicase PcrA